MNIEHHIHSLIAVIVFSFSFVRSVMLHLMKARNRDRNLILYYVLSVIARAFQMFYFIFFAMIFLDANAITSMMIKCDNDKHESRLNIFRLFLKAAGNYGETSDGR